MPTTIAEIILSPVLGAFSGGFVITVTVSFGVVGFSKITVGAAVVVTADVVTLRMYSKRLRHLFFP